MSALIEARGLTKHYDGFSLEGVDLTVSEGEVVGFIGQNGAGKSTTIKALLGLIKVDGGDASVLGTPSDKLSRTSGATTKERVGVVFDTVSLPGHLRVSDVGRIYRSAYASWDAHAFNRLARELDLDPRKAVKDLSRGMGMKLQLACALAHNPDLLILDEATAGLDPMARDEILDLLRDFMADESRGILISSHITTDLEKIADRVVCIDQGRIAFDVEKDLITDMAGVAHCRTAEFEDVRASDLFASGELRWIRQPMSVDVLVPDRFAFAKRFPHIACDRATIDDYLQLTLKGETR